MSQFSRQYVSVFYCGQRRVGVIVSQNRHTEPSRTDKDRHWERWLYCVDVAVLLLTVQPAKTLDIQWVLTLIVSLSTGDTWSTMLGRLQCMPFLQLRKVQNEIKCKIVQTYLVTWVTMNCMSSNKCCFQFFGDRKAKILQPVNSEQKLCSW